ncbi:MAG: lysophospholipid acyltransferase family protein [Pontiellaceae bacterium]|nr:lysophospholipid acyltransferase family protein [Pontiellaceae bacterium]
MKHKPADLIEYAVVVTVGGFIRILPLRAALGLGWIAAAASHFIGRVHVERTHQRIREVLGADTPDKGVRRIAWIAWRNLIFNAIEGFRFNRLSPEKIRKQPIAQSADVMNDVLKERDSGFIFATPHMGNWEIAAVAGDLLGLPLFSIVRKQRNPLINDYINKMRQTFNLELIFKETKMWHGVVKRIQDGKIMAVLPDINNRRGITVDYLNGKATIAPGAAYFAQMANCPIYPVVVRRIGWTQHHATLLEPIYPDPEADRAEDQQRIMQQLMSALSEEILKTPEQYFWHNKRWVLA